MEFKIRDFREADAGDVNRVALAAFIQYRDAFSDWRAFARGIGGMATLAASNEIIVATIDERIVGAVGYVGPHRPKAAHFKADWPLIRMLSVDPKFRGHGIGRALTDACLRRAVRDGAAEIALHTSEIMKVALPMYLRMGFVFYGHAPPIYGVPYGIYVKPLGG